MKIDFDEILDRRGTGSVRWDAAPRRYGEPDLIPLTTADMGFRTAGPIIRAICDQARQGVYGYTQPRPSYYSAIQQRLAERSGWSVERDWITYSSGIVAAIAYCIQTMTRPGEGVALLSPVYHPFAHVVRDNGRKALLSPLDQKRGRGEIDFPRLEEILASPETGMLLFCNPHNPIGIAWTREEVDRVCELCIRHGVVLVSDEIHSDLVFSGHEFHSAGASMAALGGLEQLVACTAASKGFNIPGLQCSAIIIPGEKLRGDYAGALKRQHFMEPNAVGPVATEAAYRECGDWLEQLLVYLEASRDQAAAYINSEIPGMRAVLPEATYMMWIDCRELGLSDRELEDLLVHKAKVALNPGDSFGPGGEGFVRMNFAEPRALLAEALERIRRAVAAL